MLWHRSIKMLLGSTLLLGVFSAMSFFVFASTTPQLYGLSLENDVNEGLIESAVAAAATRGLKSSGDAELDRQMVDFAVKLTRQEWENAAAQVQQRDAEDLGILADLSIVVVVIRGEVDRTKGPGLPNPDIVTPILYDNIYVVMNPFSKKPHSLVSFKPGVALPLYNSPTFAGGATAVYRSTITPEVTPLP